MSRDWTKPEPPPIPTDTQAVWPLIIESVRNGASGTNAEMQAALLEACEQRHAFGLAKYGVALKVENGREPLRDLLSEALDAMAYSRQQYERTKSAWDWALHMQAVMFSTNVLFRLMRGDAP